MFHGFLSDEIFRKSSTVERYESLPEVCYLDDQERAYFYDLVTVTDPNTDRNKIGSYTVSGKMKFHYDQSKQEENNFFTTAGTEDLKRFFKIVEKIYLFSGTREQLDLDLRVDEDLSGMYVIDSAFQSTTTVDDEIVIDGTKATIYLDAGDSTITWTIPKYIDFSIKYQNNEEKFRIWMDRKAFLDKYPLSTIIKVIYPIHPSTLIDPNALDAPVTAIIESAGYSFPNIDSKIIPLDNSGLETYYTKYKISSRSMLQLPFGILYKGNKPSSADIRKAIREDLVNYSDEDTWKQLFPQLYITNIFYMIPIYDNVTERPDKEMYPSIVKVNKVADRFKKLFTEMDESYINEHQELITVGQSEVFVVVLPDELNDKYLSLLDRFPTYQYHTSQDPAFTYQTEDTREFNIMLNRCMSVVHGETVSEDITESTIDDRKFMSFTSVDVECHVLTEEEYNDIIKN